MKKKIKKSKKVTAVRWPAQYLVLWRTTLDDIPLIITPDRRMAYRLAKNVPERMVKSAESMMGLDGCSPVNVTVIAFRNGVPFRMDIVTDEEELPAWVGA